MNHAITKDTQLFVSYAERPGNSGAYMFNAAFGALKMDCIYKPLRVSAQDLKGAVIALRALTIRGCGISMPHKTAVMKYIDVIDPVAKKIGAVNTIVNTDGILKGYNTDFWGIKKALEEKIDLRGKSALVLGAGGAARAAIMALKEGGAQDITIANRTDKKARLLARVFRIHYIPFNERLGFTADILINATSLGMAPHLKEMIITDRALNNFTAIADVVVNPCTTALSAAAEKKKKIVIPGYRIALHQAAVQFKLYTGHEAPLKIMEKKLLQLK